MKREMITFGIPGGGTARAALALPDGSDKHGAIVIAHEWWGLNEEIQKQAERFAAEGFLALAVDLYGGQVTDDAARAMELSSSVKTMEAMKVIEGAVNTLSAHPRSNGRIGVTGFCLGGAMTLAAAANVEGLSAALPFYGTPKDEFLHVDRMKMPIQGHYAKDDPFVSAERAAAIRDRVNAAGGRMEVFFYDGGHAFMRDDPSTYHEASAKLAWSRAIAFLRENLG